LAVGGGAHPPRYTHASSARASSTTKQPEPGQRGLPPAFPFDARERVARKSGDNTGEPLDRCVRVHGGDDASPTGGANVKQSCNCRKLSPSPFGKSEWERERAIDAFVDVAVVLGCGGGGGSARRQSSQQCRCRRCRRRPLTATTAEKEDAAEGGSASFPFFLRQEGLARKGLFPPAARTMLSLKGAPAWPSSPLKAVTFNVNLWLRAGLPGTSSTTLPPCATTAAAALSGALAVSLNCERTWRSMRFGSGEGIEFSRASATAFSCKRKGSADFHTGPPSSAAVSVPDVAADRHLRLLTMLRLFRPRTLTSDDSGSPVWLSPGRRRWQRRSALGTSFRGG